MFCTTCGSLLVPQGEGLGCGSCKTTTSEQTTFKERRKKEKVLEILEKTNENLPQTDADCPKCGHERAYFWTAQTRASDEPETIFLKCAECEHQWRQY